MNIMINTTLKSTLLSIGLHACVLILGSLAIYKTPMKLELTGEGGRGPIALSSINFGSMKKTATAPVKSRPVTEQTVTTRASAVTNMVSSETASVPSGTGSTSAGVNGNSGNGNGTGSGNGSDFDQGKLFSQIKVFFENRLGSTLNINVEQLIKIKLTLDKDGEILTADLIQGKLDFQALKKVLNVAKNIPLKSYWKGTAAYPEEIVIPLILSPS